MLLVWKRDTAAVEPLVEIVRYGDNPLARVHALSTLAELGALEKSVLLAATGDEHAMVRRQAVRLIEGMAADHEEVGLQLGILGFGDANAKVRLQVAHALGASKYELAPEVLAILMVGREDGGGGCSRPRDGNEPKPTPFTKPKPPVDPWIVAAALSSVRKDNVAAIIDAVLGPHVDESRRTAVLGPLVSSALGYGETDAARRALTFVTASAVGTYTSGQFAGVVAISDALERHKTNLAALTDGDENARAAVAKLVAASRTIAADESADAALRSLAAGVLARTPENRQAELDRLSAMLTPQTPSSVQIDIVDALARGGDAKNAQRVLAGWKSATPQVRERMLDALLARQSWLGELFAALERGDVLPADFDATRRGRLLSHRDDKVRARAEKLLAASIDANRGRVLAQFESALSLSGDAARGAKLFVKHCAACHRFADAGTAVGPDLAAITDKSPKALLTAMLDPNQAVEPRFRLYQALTVDGQAISGVLAAETAHSVTLVAQDGRRHVLVRGDLEQFQNTAKSLMPEGLEKELDAQAAADLIAHLRSKP
jgi:putative heme-binding domain-containing protein